MVEQSICIEIQYSYVAKEIHLILPLLYLHSSCTLEEK